MKLLAVLLLMSVMCARADSIAWNFEFCVTDTLEFADTPAGPWRPVPGPYSLNSDGTQYHVEFMKFRPAVFFRVSRRWGNPDVLTENLPAHTVANSAQCISQ